MRHTAEKGTPQRRHRWPAATASASTRVPPSGRVPLIDLTSFADPQQRPQGVWKAHLWPAEHSRGGQEAVAPAKAPPQEVRRRTLSPTIVAAAGASDPRSSAVVNCDAYTQTLGDAQLLQPPTEPVVPSVGQQSEAGLCEPLDLLYTHYPKFAGSLLRRSSERPTQRHSRPRAHAPAHAPSSSKKTTARKKPAADRSRAPQQPQQRREVRRDGPDEVMLPGVMDDSDECGSDSGSELPFAPPSSDTDVSAAASGMTTAWDLFLEFEAESKEGKRVPESASQAEPEDFTFQTRSVSRVQPPPPPPPPPRYVSPAAPSAAAASPPAPRRRGLIGVWIDGDGGVFTVPRPQGGENWHVVFELQSAESAREQLSVVSTVWSNSGGRVTRRAGPGCAQALTAGAMLVSVLSSDQKGNQLLFELNETGPSDAGTAVLKFESVGGERRVQRTLRRRVEEAG